MNKCEFGRRLKRLVREECKVSEMETKIAVKSSKYYQQMSHLKTLLNKQEHELSIYRKEIYNLKLNNDKLEKTIQEKETLLCETIQRIEEMQKEYRQTLQEEIDKRSGTSAEADCIRSLKLSSRTFINLSALPHSIQGVTLCEKETSTDWKPFCFDPLEHTQKEIQDSIWHDTQVDSVHRKMWEKIILGDLIEDQRVDMETESGDVTVVT